MDEELLNSEQPVESDATDTSKEEVLNSVQILESEATDSSTEEVQILTVVFEDATYTDVIANTTYFVIPLFVLIVMHVLMRIWSMSEGR